MQEPSNRALWMAEAENWSRLSRKFCASRKKNRLASSGDFADAAGQIFINLGVASVA
jgi:hypothetical protein